MSALFGEMSKLQRSASLCTCVNSDPLTEDQLADLKKIDYLLGAGGAQSVGEEIKSLLKALESGATDE